MLDGCGNGGPEPALGAASPGVVDLPPELLDELAERAAAALPAVAAAIPAEDAEQIGRLGLPEPGAQPGQQPGPVPRPSGSTGEQVGPTVGPAPSADDEAWRAAQRSHDDPLTRGVVGGRLLAAVGPVLDGLALDAPPELAPYVRVTVPDGTAISVATIGDDEVASATAVVSGIGPELIPWIAAITGALADHERVAPLLRAGQGSEPEIVAAHGRVHLALAMVVAGMVLPASQVPLPGSEPPAAVVGTAVEAVAEVLPARPQPDTYPAALQERRRAEFRFPAFATVQAQVRGHRFGLLEGALPTELDEPANGLVTAVPHGLVVRTGTEEGRVLVSVEVLAGPPPADDLRSVQEAVEVGFTTAAGGASIVTDGQVPGGLREITPPWPGPLRARVTAYGRDDGYDEHYGITVWPAPEAPETVLKATDALGHRLRGEPEPTTAARPEAAYRWLAGSSLGEAATVTVVTGSTVEQVIEAFGGDPGRPVPLTDDLMSTVTPFVSVLPVDGAVIAVEVNGWQGSTDEVLRAASARGRAASMYWNVEADTNLAFARGGRVVESFEPLFVHDAADGEVRTALAGIDWADFHDLNEKGLVAVERYTGHGITAEQIDRIWNDATVYVIPG